ncbi:hypothetical protein KSD_66460 [Ktedonobacter sp. SOSP1-85]|uniref:pilin n=1 Tax=Ktedonobacter sp. SOSP1-85 TaxID=2778367 RepID=UPI001915E93D|nr:pilin [Ktedonobacter sp. SOSP1-85]GHO78875.1 hypothetical protein KSD_66460 [Ktedonobacter sp. SOSP1-85]
MFLLHIAQLMIDPHLVLNQVHGIIPVFNNISSALQHLAPPPTPGDPKSTGDPYKDIVNFANSIRSLVYVLGFTIFLIGIIGAGIMRILSFGSDRRVAMSNMALTAAVIGLIIILLGAGLSTLLQNAFQK